MDENPVSKDESTSSSLMELLKKYTNKVNERENLDKEEIRLGIRQAQKIQSNEIEKLKDPRTKSQSQTNSTPDKNQQMDDEKLNLYYKMKFEESEAKYRQLETKYHQLETNTIQQLQDKVDQLQRDYNQMKLIKDRIAEICSCRQLTTSQFEQLKLLVNNNNFSMETIATKNDFHQQTRKLRDILLKHNDELFDKLDEMIKKKRKRNQYEDESSDIDEERN